MDIRNLSPIFAVLVSITLLNGCDVPPPAEQAPQNSWFRAMDNPKHEFINYPEYLFRAVDKDLVAEAEQALGDSPLLQLSTAEAERYTNSELHMPMELRPFLIHGLKTQNQRYTVYFADRALWVDSFGDPGSSVQPARHPLVIFIDEVPPDVYVTHGATDGTSGAQTSQQ